jgi:hypothetical protein
VLGAEVDTTKLVRAGNKLASELKSGGTNTAQRQASNTAERIRAQTPVRTGALASTVGAVPDGLGYGVTYGGGLKYAWVIEKRQHPVRLGVQGAPEEFANACHQLAQAEVRSL